ncbi:DctP family TRAP transporter solute-binding subunit [Vibrio sp. H11]|uniref:DctP family TRAP transporter solute-binding subunit n=1 Tax=Vibrio sp. H11 TaxID=2565928 RepID=UPI0010A6A256|nr:DctP family TRAP transporter solute-binding subunit [Vibrio sp. H11]
MYSRLAIKCFSILFACSTIGFSVQAKTYRLSHNVSNTTTWQEGAEKFNELLSEATDGDMKVRIFPNSVLTGGDQIKQAEMLGANKIDFVLTSAINVTPLIPEMAVFSLPYLFDDYKAVDDAINGPGGKKIEQIALDKNIIILAWGENGFRELTNSVKAVKSPDDLQGMSVRVAGPMYIDVFTDLGANPQQIQWAETFPALQQGVVDGQENPVGAIIVPQRLYEIQNNITLWHYSYDPIFLAVSRKVWDSLDAETQQKVSKAAQEAMQYQREISRQKTADGVQVLRDNNMHVMELTPEQIDAFRQKTKPSYNKWKEKVGTDIVGLFEG